MINLFIAHDPQSPGGPDKHSMLAILGEQPDIRICGDVQSADEALTALRRTPCDVVLAHYELPDDGALRLVRTLAAGDMLRKVLVIGIPSNETAIFHMIEEGAAGYVCVDESWADLVKKIRAVAEDEFMLGPDIASTLMARISELKQLLVELDGGNIARPEPIYADLTQRELEVLRLIGQDMSNQEIAEALTIELGTVKNHVHNLLRKLDVCSRKHAAQLARQMLAEPES
jgi:two-component system, NarL family, nitrate/nitrite response regulator NarL